MQVEKQNQFEIKLLQYATENPEKIISLSAFTALVLATVHEFAYYNVVDLSYFSVAGFQDYVKTTLLWLPFVIFSQVIAAITIEFFAPFAAARITPFLPQNVSVRRNSRKPLIMLFAFIFIMPLTVAAFAASYILPFLIFCFLVLTCILIKYNVFNVRVSKTNLYVVSTVFVLIIGSYQYGEQSAKFDLTRTDPAFLLKTTSGSELVIAMRSLDKGILLRRPLQGTVELIPWEQIVSLSSHRSVAPVPMWQNWRKSGTEDFAP